MKSLHEWLGILESRHPTEIDLGLDRVAEVFNRLGDVRPAGTIVTVGGTNGKGSFIAMLESLALAAGKSVAAYTSPHLIHFNERVRVNGEPVSNDDLCAAFDVVEKARGNISLTYFEFTTLAAFVVMANSGVDVALLEVGLGGRLDAVNILDADIAVVTSIDLDHQDWLGDTREAVAREKLGIARRDKWLLCGETDLPSNFENEVAIHGARALYRGRDFALDEAAGEFVVDALGMQAKHSYTHLPTPALPLPSAACAVQAALLLGLPLSEAQISNSLVNTGLSGRFQTVDYQGRKLILDVAHNPAAAKLLSNNLAQAGHSKVAAVVAMMKDKDIAGVLEPVSAQIDNWYVAGLPDMPRAASSADLSELLYNLLKRETKAEASRDLITVSNTVIDALQQALTDSDEGSTILVFGSFFTVSAALQLLQ